MPNFAYFIDDEIFDTQILTYNVTKDRKSLGIHSSEAGVLRTELIKILRETSSLENWDFLHTIRQINFQRNLSPEEIKPQLIALYEKFVAQDAPEQLNLSGPVFKAIHSKYLAKRLSPQDFVPAIKMVFADSILSNLSGSQQLHLAECEKTINDVNTIIQELIEIVKLTQTGGSKIRFLDRKPSTSELKNAGELNQDAKTACDALVALRQQQNISLNDFKSQAGDILNRFVTQTNKSMVNVAQMNSKDELSVTNITNAVFKIQKTMLDAGLNENSAPESKIKPKSRR